MLKNLLKKELRLEKIFLFAISIFVFLTMYYYDNQIVFVEVMKNMDRIVNGQWYYFFNGWSAIPYGLVLQGICVIWSLPVFILSEMGIISVTCVGARLWYKLFVLIFLLLDTWQIGKVAEKWKGFSERKILWLRLFFLSSLLVILPAVHVAQMDAVYLFFILLGINYYLSNEHWKFLLSFMIAIPGKYIPLFIFIPLILLNEKRYLYIIRDLVIGCALVVVDLGMNSIGYRIETYLGIDKSLEIGQNNTMYSCFDTLLSISFEAFKSPMSIAVLCFGILCIWCFIKDRRDKETLAVYVSFIGFAILFAFGDSTPYWIILIAPFQLLLIMASSQFYDILFPLEVAFMLAYNYIYIFKNSWILGADNTFSFLVCSLIPGYNDKVHGFISDFFTQRGLNGFEGIMAATLVVSIIGTIALTNPLKEKNDRKIEEEKYLKGWYWVRLGIVYGWIALNIWVVMLNHVN